VNLSKLRKGRQWSWSLSESRGTGRKETSYAVTEKKIKAEGGGYLLAPYLEILDHPGKFERWWFVGRLDKDQRTRGKVGGKPRSRETNAIRDSAGGPGKGKGKPKEVDQDGQTPTGTHAWGRSAIQGFGLHMHRFGSSGKTQKGRGRTSSRGLGAAVGRKKIIQKALGEGSRLRGDGGRKVCAGKRCVSAGNRGPSEPGEHSPQPERQ